MPDPNKPWTKKDKEDFDRGASESGGNPFDFVLKAYQKLRGEPQKEDQQQGAPQTCPNCGHTIGNEINYPQGAS